MPGTHAEFEECIQHTVGELHADAHLRPSARPISVRPQSTRCQAGRPDSTLRLPGISPSTRLNILGHPGPVQTQEKRASAGPVIAAHSHLALFPVTDSTGSVGPVDNTPACEYSRQRRRRPLELDAE